MMTDASLNLNELTYHQLEPRECGICITAGNVSNSQELFIETSERMNSSCMVSHAAILRCPTFNTLFWNIQIIDFEFYSNYVSPVVCGKHDNLLVMRYTVGMPWS